MQICVYNSTKDFRVAQSHAERTLSSNFIIATALRRSFRIFNSRDAPTKEDECWNTEKFENAEKLNWRSNKRNDRVMTLRGKFSLLNWKKEGMRVIYVRVLLKFQYTYLPVHLPADLFKMASPWAWKRRIRKGTIGILIENLVVADGIPRRSSRNRVRGGLSALLLDTCSQSCHTVEHKRPQNTKEAASSNSSLLLLSPQQYIKIRYWIIQTWRKEQKEKISTFFVVM